MERLNKKFYDQIDAGRVIVVEPPSIVDGSATSADETVDRLLAERVGAPASHVRGGA